MEFGVLVWSDAKLGAGKRIVCGCYAKLFILSLCTI
jgi:hypothetical protein